MGRPQARLTNRPSEGHKAEKQWGFHALFFAAVVTLVVWIGYRFSQASIFPVRHVQLSGELSRLDMDQVREAVLPFVMRGLLRFNVTEVSTAVTELPWVRHAAVRRVWPDVVAVEIAEENPMARWGDVALVNEEGRLFRPPNSEWPATLPVLEGPQNTVQLMTERYRELRQVLAPVGLKVVRLTMNERRSFSLQLDDGMRLMLGRNDQQARLERFVRAYGKVVEGRASDVRKVDLRYTNGFTVVWKQHGPQA